MGSLLAPLACWHADHTPQPIRPPPAAQMILNIIGIARS